MTAPVRPQLEVHFAAIDALLLASVSPANATGVNLPEVEKVRGTLHALEAAARVMIPGTTSA